MKKLLILILISGTVLTSLYFLRKPQRSALRIGLLVPIQNVALDDIVHGFKTELAQHMGDKPFEISVHNAMGDINLQRSALNQLVNHKVDLLVPIGKGASLMAMSLAPRDLPILFLAALIPPKSEMAQQKPGLMGIIDEVPVELQLNVMRAVIPSLTKFTVVYSSSDKVFDDVKDLVEKAKNLGINVQQLMVQNVSELYTVTSQIEADSQALFTLKDVLVASGINALVKQANALKIPLVTSDEGTVKSGAAFSVGVTEADIGRQGARMAKSFFDKAQVDPIQYLDRVSVFVNKTSCVAQGVDHNTISHVAASLKLAVVEG